MLSNHIGLMSVNSMELKGTNYFNNFKFINTRNLIQAQP